MLERVDIGKLLRIKRYERPPPDHFERFLDEFHRRYPAGPTRRSAWRSAVERLQADLARLAESRSACAAAGGRRRPGDPRAYFIPWTPIRFPSESTKCAKNPYGPMSVRGTTTRPPARSIRATCAATSSQPT